MKAARAAIMLLASLVLWGCGAANAAEVKIDLGVTQLSPIENGNWYQDGFPHRLQLTSPSASLSVFTDPDASGLQLGIGVMEVARPRSNAYVLDYDPNYNQDSPTHCNGPCGHLSHMTGQGNIDNWFIALRQNEGNGFFQIALAATTYHWKTTNPDWYGPGSSSTIGPLMSITVADPKTSYGLALAAGYRFDKQWAFIFKIDPTHTATGNPGLSRGVSPTAALEYTF